MLLLKPASKYQASCYMRGSMAPKQQALMPATLVAGRVAAAGILWQRPPDRQRPSECLQWVWCSKMRLSRVREAAWCGGKSLGASQLHCARTVASRTNRIARAKVRLLPDHIHSISAVRASQQGCAERAFRKTSGRARCHRHVDLGR